MANSRLAYENLTIGVSEQTGDKFKLNIGIDSINPAALLKSVCFMNEIKHQFLNKDVLMPLLDKYTTDEELKRVLVGNRSLQIEVTISDNQVYNLLNNISYRNLVKD